MASYAALARKKNELIRRAKAGSVFVATMDVEVPENLTSGVDAGLITLNPAEWRDLGWLSTEGVNYERTTESVDTNSFGSSEATRSDVTRDEISLSCTAQETHALTMGITTGADIAAIKANAVTGEVQIAKPARPKLRFYRTLGLFLDHDDDGEEIYFGRLMPRAQVNDFGSQGYNEDETGISYPMVWRGKEDSSLGFSHKWFWGGPGWRNLLEAMEIPLETP
ncbi:hypothetical protein AB0F93_00085 [Micromonospora tulbaghiae]|uniref:phage tail tube protein n=1 Tax=Micromonospora tulbaghiae TaxID=479978 RepID=UPI003318FAC8